MIPCPNCRSRNLKTRDVATTLWPTPLVNKLRACKDCGCIFETLEVHGKMVKPPLPKQNREHHFPNDTIISNVLRNMEVGDYMIAKSNDDRIKFTGAMIKVYGIGCHRTKRIKETNTYHCMRIK